MPFWTSSGVLELRDYVPRLTHTPLSAAAPRGSPRCRIAAHHGFGRRVGERVLAGRADAPLLHVRVRRRRRGAAHALRRPLRQLHHAPIFLLRALFLMPALWPGRLLAGPAAVERRDPALLARPVHGGSKTVPPHAPRHAQSVSDEGRASFFFTGGSASSAGVEFLRVRRKGISGDTSVMVNHRSWTQRGGIDELLLPETTPPLGMVWRRSTSGTYKRRLEKINRKPNLWDPVCNKDSY